MRQFFSYAPRMEARFRAGGRDQLLGLSAHQNRKRFIGITLFWLNVFLLAIIVRLPWIHVISADYLVHYGPWYRFIVYNGFFAALRYEFSDYNVPYLYLLAAVAFFFPGIKSYLAIKGLSIIFDFVLAFFVYKCVHLKYSQTEIVPRLAALVTLLIPTVILNGSAWGQSDVIYTALLVASLWALLSGHQIWAFVAYGLSFSFKLQSVFLAPLFLWLLAKKRVSLRCFILIPLVYLNMLMPAWIIGRPLDDLLLIYINLVNEGEQLVWNTPNLYMWIPNHYYSWYPLGVAFTALVVIVIALLVYKSPVRMTRDLLVHLATFSTLIVPFLLPKMHERYFLPANVFAVIFAFYFPKFWYTPVVIGLVSFLTDIGFLYGVPTISLKWLAVLPLALIVILGWKLLRTLEYLPSSRKYSTAVHWGG